MDQPTIRLAVYGTLKSNHGNHMLLGEDCKVVARGIRVPNLSLYEIGWFPGAVRDEEGAGVECEIVDIPASVLRLIDGYEGFEPERDKHLSLFVREVVKLDNGEEVIMYLFNRNVKDDPNYHLIPSGKWEY